MYYKDEDSNEVVRHTAHKKNSVTKVTKVHEEKCDIKL
jgi:hypothetical protein